MCVCVILAFTERHRCYHGNEQEGHSGGNGEEEAARWLSKAWWWKWRGRGKGVLRKKKINVYRERVIRLNYQLKMVMKKKN